METTIIELENALITGTYVNLCNQLVKDAYLENGYISGGSYRRVTFENVVFKDSEIQASAFEDCVFIDCKFINCNFNFTKFVRCNFVACTIDNCNFCITNSHSSNYLSCSLTNNLFTECKVDQATLIDSILDLAAEEIMVKEQNVIEQSFNQLQQGQMAAQEGLYLISEYKNWTITILKE